MTELRSRDTLNSLSLLKNIAPAKAPLDDPQTRGTHMDRIAQGITNRSHCGAQTEDQRFQDSHSQLYAVFDSSALA
jgi:hypothetical protein